MKIDRLADCDRNLLVSHKGIHEAVVKKLKKEFAREGHSNEWNSIWIWLYEFWIGVSIFFSDLFNWMQAMNFRCNMDYRMVWRIMTCFVFTFVSRLSEFFSQKRMSFVLFCSGLFFFFASLFCTQLGTWHVLCTYCIFRVDCHLNIEWFNGYYVNARFFSLFSATLRHVWLSDKSIDQQHHHNNHQHYKSAFQNRRKGTKQPKNRRKNERQ